MFSFGDYEGFLLGHIKSVGSIQYSFIFGVFENKIPVLYYTAEKSSISEEVFIGVFKDDKHINLGSDAQSSDQMTFLSKALNYVCETFSIKLEDIKELPKKSAEDTFGKIQK